MAIEIERYKALRRVAWHGIASHRVASRRVALRRAVSPRLALCRVALHYVALRYVTLTLSYVGVQRETVTDAKARARSLADKSFIQRRRGGVRGGGGGGDRWLAIAMARADYSTAYKYVDVTRAEACGRRLGLIALFTRASNSNCTSSSSSNTPATT